MVSRKHGSLLVHSRCNFVQIAFKPFLEPRSPLLPNMVVNSHGRLPLQPPTCSLRSCVAILLHDRWMLSSETSKLRWMSGTLHTMWPLF